MKNFALLLTVLAFFTSNSNFGQSEDIQLTKKDSVVQSSWIFGLGYNFVDDSGDVFDDLLAIDTQWNALPYPNRLSIGRYFKSGVGIEAIGTYNKYKAGKIIDKVVNDSDKTYLAIDARLSYDLNKLIGQTAWFDPYVGVGLGYTDANNEPRSTYNAIVGFRTWFSDRLGLDFNTSGKWRTGDVGTNHIQHAAGIVYQFGIEKGLSKKGREKLALLEALQKEKQRVNDSINAAREAAEASALAERLAQEKEKARLAAIEQAEVDAEKSRRQRLEDEIDRLGYVYFDLNSSYLTNASKTVLTKLADLLKENPNLELRVVSHTDSRGRSNYNKWLSQRRVNRTVDFLMQLGIASNRLAAEAYGEEKLLNECDDHTYCPEEKHQLNRRSEFIIMKY
ncbi:MAG: OmpA family protein [Maribacter sp.]|uniref:OmpA family protein n=1 Tax=Maribacter sp. TaxID=1897614 RepID=UPI003298A0CF